MPQRDRARAPVHLWRRGVAAGRASNNCHERRPARPLLLQINRHDRVLARGMSGRAVAEVVKRACARAGIDPVEFSGHSLRAGLVTAAAAAGVAEVDIARTSRHKSVPVLRRYVREASVFTRNAAGAVL